jgi:hypothetical protein
MSLRDSSIAALVSAFGTSSSIGNAWSLTTRFRKIRTASDTDNPIAANGLGGLGFDVVIDTDMEHGTFTHLELLKKNLPEAYVPHTRDIQGV